eukprot:Skav235009  [mRNA]  locus=scaffold276:129481:138130:+ [translate_table: standard]
MWAIGAIDGLDTVLQAPCGPGCWASPLRIAMVWIAPDTEAGCDPKGGREKAGDKDCREEIGTGSSGFCALAGSVCFEFILGEHQSNLLEDAIDDGSRSELRPPAISMRDRMLATQAARYRCVGWRQTGGCSADGPREPNRDRDTECKDQPCRALIDSRSSGYCECGGGRIIRKPGCAHGEWAEPFTCSDECAGEASLYEELGVDSGASDKEIKRLGGQRHEKKRGSIVKQQQGEDMQGPVIPDQGLRGHDKTRNDPVLSARFAQIREAYDILGDEGQRAIYDSAGLQLLA